MIMLIGWRDNQPCHRDPLMIQGGILVRLISPTLAQGSIMAKVIAGDVNNVTEVTRRAIPVTFRNL